MRCSAPTHLMNEDLGLYKDHDGMNVFLKHKNDKMENRREDAC